MRYQLFSFAFFSSLVLVACSPEASQPAAIAAPADAIESSQAKPKPEPHYTTEPATGAFEELVPQGYEIVKAEAGQIIAYGDLNGNQKDDAAILIQNMEEEQGSAAILIAYDMRDGGWAMGEMTGNLGPEPLMYPDPGQLKIEKGVLIFHYQSMRWSADLKFRREAKYGDLRLIGFDTENYGNAVHDGAGSSSTNYLTGQRISNYMSWDEEIQDLVELPEKREKVSTKLKPFSTYNEDSLYNSL